MRDRFDIEQVLRITGLGIRADQADGGADFDVACRIAVQKIRKAKEYEDLEEQGKLLKLSCAVGDTVYRFYTVDDKTKIYEHRITTLTNIVNIMEAGEIGKTVFLTKSDAEQALKEMEGKK